MLIYHTPQPETDNRNVKRCETGAMTRGHHAKLPWTSLWLTLVPREPVGQPIVASLRTSPANRPIDRIWALAEAAKHNTTINYRSLDHPRNARPLKKEPWEVPMGVTSHTLTGAVSAILPNTTGDPVANRVALGEPHVMAGSELSWGGVSLRSKYTQRRICGPSRNEQTSIYG